MPIYDYQCKTCQTIYVDTFHKLGEEISPCGKCGTELSILISKPTVHTFHEGHYEHLTGDEKTWFTSKKQLKTEARKRGKYSEYAED